MKQIHKNNLTYLSYFDNDSCCAGFSTRKSVSRDGLSKDLDLGLYTNSPKEEIAENRDSFFQTVAPEMKVVNLKQTHSTNVFRVPQNGIVEEDGDGLITTHKNILLCASAADCGTVLFHDTAFTFVAAVHCGWKGTRDGILQNIAFEMSKVADLKDVVAYIGPMIQKKSYEVGKEFDDYFDEKYLEEKDDKYLLDLPQAVVDTLQSEGIGTVINANMDTLSNTDLFFSYRAEGETGRMLAYIGLKG